MPTIKPHPTRAAWDCLERRIQELHEMRSYAGLHGMADRLTEMQGQVAQALDQVAKGIPPSTLG